MLEPILYFTNALSGAKLVTVPAVHLLLNYIIKHILVVVPEEKLFVSQMKAKISEYLQQHNNSLTVTSVAF